MTLRAGARRLRATKDVAAVISGSLPIPLINNGRSAVGHPRTIVLAHKAYDANSIRELIEAKGAVPNIPAKRSAERRSSRHLDTTLIKYWAAVGTIAVRAMFAPAA